MGSGMGIRDSCPPLKSGATLIVKCRVTSLCVSVYRRSRFGSGVVLCVSRKKTEHRFGSNFRSRISGKDAVGFRVFTRFLDPRVGVVARHVSPRNLRPDDDPTDAVAPRRYPRSKPVAKALAVAVP